MLEVMLDFIHKAKQPRKTKEQVALEQALTQEEQVLKRAFTTFLKRVRDPAVLKKITALLRKGDTKGALDVITDYVTEFTDQLPRSFQSLARDEVARSYKALHLATKSPGSAKFTFEPGEKRAAQMMRRSQLRFIKNFTDKQRQAVRAALADSLERGDNPLTAARRIKSSIGLTENQYRAVDNYQSMLERGSREALTRQLRDARFDSTVEGAIERNDVLTDSQIERMVERYTERMLQFRANNIARTEAMRTMSEARQASWWQMATETGADPTKVKRTWFATLDGRERETHEEMHGQTVIGMDTPFESPSGEELLYPGDPEADEDETINCRCTVLFNVGSSLVDVVESLL